MPDSITEADLRTGSHAGGLGVRCLFLVLILVGMTQGVRLFFQILMPADLTLNESSAILGGWHWLRGELMYPDWRIYPHRLNPYGPLSIMGPAWLSQWFGGQGEWSVLYALGRTQSFLSLMLGAGIAAWAVVRSGWGWWAGWAAAAVALIAWPLVTAGCMHARPDALAAGLGLLAVVLASRGWLWTAGLLAGIVLGCKANAIAAGAVVGLIAVSQVGLIRALGGFGLLVALWFGAILGWQAVTGERYLDQAITCGDVGWNLANWRQHLGWLMNPSMIRVLGWDTVVRLGLLVVGAAVALRGTNWLGLHGSWSRFLWGPGAGDGEEPAHPWTPLNSLAALGLVSLALNSVLLMKVGSASNYFLESLLALAGPGVGLLCRWQGQIRGRWILGLWALSLGVNLPVVALETGQAVAFGTLESKPLATAMEAPAGSLLADLSFTHPDPATRLMNDPFYVAVLINRGMLEPGGLVQRIRNQEYPEIFVSTMMRGSFSSGPSTQILQAIEESYRPHSRSVVFVRYLPRR